MWERFCGSPRRIRAILVSAAFVGAAIVAVIAVTSPQAQSVVRLFGLNPADDLRARAIPTIVALTRDFFPFGTGFGGFEPAYRAAEPFALLTTRYLNEAHNDYLQVAVEGGIFGIFVLLAAGAWFLARAVDAFRATGDRLASVAARTGALMIILVALASAVDYPVRTPLIMVTLVIAAAWLTLPRCGEPEV
jgi:O-antigen ligase